MNGHEPYRGSLSICVVLVALLIVCTVIGSVASLAFAAFVTALLAAEVDRSGRLIGTRIVRAASWLLPRSLRADCESEWIDHVLRAGEEGLRPVLAALGIALIGAPRIALRLRLRPAAGRYLLALILVAVEVVRADPNERRRGSMISLAKALVRLGALPVTPLLALPVARRLDRVLPRWLLYAVGLAIEWYLSTLTVGTSIWITVLVACATTAVMLTLSTVVVNEERDDHPLRVAVGEPARLTRGRRAHRGYARTTDGHGKLITSPYSPSPTNLCARGYLVMRGDWNDPERTGESIDPAGWMHSGDLATLDDDGYVPIVGRIKDMVIRGGENIYPREIEEFLYTRPEIADVQVVGVPDERYGEELMAWIVSRPGAALTDEDVREFCRGRIAHFKVPRYVKFVDAFPMTVTGKVQKFKLREAAIEELGLACAAAIATA